MLYFTGGGSYVLTDLLTKPGASNTVLEARIPYSQRSMRELLGSDIDSFCSKQAACMLAMHAFQRSLKLAASDDLFGLGCTASLRSTEPKRGSHRAHIALQTARKTVHWEIEFTKGELTRESEERKLADVVVSSLLNGLDLSEDSIQNPTDLHSVGVELEELLLNRRAHVNKRADAFLPGSFNPLHRGHRKMKQIAEKHLGCSVQYELCIHNVDKPSLNYLELRKRLQQFDFGDCVLTNAPKFVDKARQLNDSKQMNFVVGIDTLQRIVSSDYYGGNDSLRDDAVAELIRLDTRFIVFGRIVDGKFKTLDDIKLSSDLRRRCLSVNEEEFRVDVSSTVLRDSGAS